MGAIPGEAGRMKRFLVHQGFRDRRRMASASSETAVVGTCLRVASAAA